MLTARGRRTIALALIVGLAGRILGLPELFGLAAAVVVVVLASLVQVRVAKGVVRVVARVVPPIVQVGDRALCELVVEEAGVTAFATALVLVAERSQDLTSNQPARVIVPRLGRGARAQAIFELSTRTRGVIKVGEYQAIVMDPLGLSQRGLSSSRAVTLTVLPRVEPLATLMPHGLNWLDYETAAQSIVTGSSMLRRYQQGDDLRRVHWRTTARVGALVVRDGGESDDPERRATTVLLDAGGPATPPEEMDRAVEVAASVLSSAAHPSRTGVSGAYRLVTTAGWDSGAQHRDDGLEDTLVALAALGPAPFPARERLATAIGRLGRADRDELLFVVGAFGQSPPDRAVLEHLARRYSGVVVVLVCPASPPPRDEPVTGYAGGTGAAVRAVSTGDSGPRGDRERPAHGVLTLRLPLNRPLAAVWGLDPKEPNFDSYLSGEWGAGEVPVP